LRFKCKFDFLWNHLKLKREFSWKSYGLCWYGWILVCRTCCCLKLQSCLFTFYLFGSFYWLKFYMFVILASFGWWYYQNTIWLEEYKYVYGWPSSLDQIYRVFLSRFILFTSLRLPHVSFLLLIPYLNLFFWWAGVMILAKLTRLIGFRLILIRS